MIVSPLGIFWASLEITYLIGLVFIAFLKLIIFDAIVIIINNFYWITLAEPIDMALI